MTEGTIRELVDFRIAARSGHRQCADFHQRFSREIKKTEIGGAAVGDIATLAPPPPLFMRNSRDLLWCGETKRSSSIEDTVRNPEGRAAVFAGSAPESKSL